MYIFFGALSDEGLRPKRSRSSIGEALADFSPNYIFFWRSPIRSFPDFAKFRAEALARRG